MHTQTISDFSFSYNLIIMKKYIINGRNFKTCKSILKNEKNDWRMIKMNNKLLKLKSTELFFVKGMARLNRISSKAPTYKRLEQPDFHLIWKYNITLCSIRAEHWMTTSVSRGRNLQKKIKFFLVYGRKEVGGEQTDTGHRRQQKLPSFKYLSIQ